MSSAPYLEASGVKKSFGLKPILRGIELTLAEGGSLALLGANGAGKTTLLRILAGLAKPDAGSVRLGELDYAHDMQQVRRLVGFVAHQPYLYDELTALENLLFFGRMYSVPDARERAQTLLGKVGLERRARERVGSLSRGQVQRLALARALLHAPRLLLLDEAETGLDEQGSALLETLLAEHRKRGGTILFTTHQPERALQLADHVAMLSGGRIVSHQATAALALDGVRRAYQEALR